MSRAPGLDLLRAVAILAVMYSHTQLFGLRPIDDPVASFGWMGVDLFFALSGFLIGGQLFRLIAAGEAVRPGLFYLRRLFRTAPAYLVVVAVYFAFPVVRERDGIAPLWQFLTFTENLFVDFARAKTFSHVWSLCVEEQFYLVVPLAAWLLAGRRGGVLRPAAIVALLLGGMALRAHIWLHDLAPQHGQAFTFGWMEKIYYPTWTRLDGLLAGLAFAEVRAFRPGLWQAIARRANLLLALGLAGVAVSIWICGDQRSFVASVFGFPILSISMGLLVAAGASSGSLIGARAVPGAGLIAGMAYSLYLTHKQTYHLAQMLAGPWLAAHPPLAVAAYAGAALGVGSALYLLVERPFLKLRDRILAPAGRAAPAEAPRLAA
ncbi:acyltransferase family protein [Phenylobacterium soli]|uniref:Acyltransferase n=1 Tax=Phenylobacterium soli TaxID=2170551 RepID=A0A328AJT9_9CAUL|nr:acyltransferase [Phenylobacterium soli]RAK55223.1 acyltransferase [Phenylobacterium soli]